jgi:hypothetical protein
MTIPTPANDNTPRHADEFNGDLAARRAWVAARPRKTKRVLAWPTAERLARLASPNAAQALMRYADLSTPARMVAANDNSEPEVDRPDIDPDMIHEVRPGVREVLRHAASDGMRCSVTSTKLCSGWTVIAKNRGANTISGRLGDLVFRDGALVSFGCTERGAVLRPREQQSEPKGATTPKRSAESIRYLLATDAPIAKGAIFLGGVTRSRGNCSRPDMGDAEAALELQRNARRDAVRLALGPEASAVLDLAVTDTSAREIGELCGYAGKTAERKAIRLINGALEKLSEIAA